VLFVVDRDGQLIPATSEAISAPRPADTFVLLAP